MRSCLTLALIVLAGLFAAPGFAQDAASDLDATSAELQSTVNEFGQTVVAVTGLLENTGTVGYTDVFLSARAFDDDGEPIGEGFGVLVDACGAGLLPGTVMPPGHLQPYSAPLEFFIDSTDPAARVDRIEVEAQAAPADEAPDSGLPDGLTRLSDQETIRVEWIDDQSLRYAIGCPRDLFSEWEWRQVSLATGLDRPIEHPDADLVTDDLAVQLDLEDPTLFDNSRLSFAPEGGRMAYQDSVNRFYTAADDGTLQRRLYSGLNSRVLQTIQWLGGDRFLAVYYGGVGEPILWFTADAEARAISPAPTNNRPSVTIPGASPDGRRVILGGAFLTDGSDPIIGYYLNVVTNGFFELLFEAELPGSNYPAPVPVIDPAEDLVARIFVAAPGDEAPILQCFNRADGTLHELASLPSGLNQAERSALWLSPDGTSLALSMNGPAGGLWLIDLTALPPCTGE